TFTIREATEVDWLAVWAMSRRRGRGGIIAAREGVAMVTLYVGGQKVAWADAEKVFAEPAAASRPIELRNDAGKVVARVVPEPATSAPDDPDWVKAITPEE